MSERKSDRVSARVACVLLLSLGGCTWPWTRPEPQPVPPTQAPPDQTPQKPDEGELPPDDGGDDPLPLGGTDGTNGTNGTDGGEGAGGDEVPPPVGGIPTAASVPGRPGFVFSPFNNKIIDVKGIPSGTIVADPQFPKEAKKHFRVP
jgi:hypothetical protein